MRTLTPRMRQVLGWACVGKSVEETADLLGIKRETVHYHRQNVIMYYRAANLTHAVALAVYCGDVNPELVAEKEKTCTDWIESSQPAH